MSTLKKTGWLALPITLLLLAGCGKPADKPAAPAEGATDSTAAATGGYEDEAPAGAMPAPGTAPAEMPAEPAAEPVPE